MPDARSAERDRAAILAHIGSIFEAYFRRDRVTIRKTHTEDWRGFQVATRRIVRGLAQYVDAAEEVLKTLKATRYEMLDTEVDVHGDLALVWYLARDWLDDGAGGERPVLLRALDVYRREPAGWNQCGSHVSALSEGAWPTEVTDADRRELLSVRESVWRAFFENDRAKLEQLLPPETLAINAGSEPWLDRARALAMAQEWSAGGLKLLALEFPRTEIQRYADVAILSSHYRWEAEMSGKRESVAGRATELFVRRGGRWLNAGWHLDSGE